MGSACSCDQAIFGDEIVDTTELVGMLGATVDVDPVVDVDPITAALAPRMPPMKFDAVAYGRQARQRNRRRAGVRRAIRRPCTVRASNAKRVLGVSERPSRAQ